ncbi:MAG: hypothetical protein MR357_00660 [Anaeroplasma sp.]|nr:hypothetical protein [Anaeroplasma sp.]
MRIDLKEDLRSKIYNNCYNLLADSYSRVSESSLRKNLDLWAKNKKGLYDILSTSPYWNEEELCLVVKTRIYRKLNYNLFIQMMNNLMENHQVQNDVWKKGIAEGCLLISNCIRRKEFDGFVKQEELDAIRSNFTAYYSSELTNDEILAQLADKKYHGSYRSSNGIAHALIIKYKVRSGQKWCKILNKIMEGEGLNVGKTDLYNCKNYEEVKGVRDYVNKNATDWYIDYYYNYNQFFALMSDILTPTEYDETLYISLNPIDYLTQSHGDNWGSCHSLRNRGCYHAATLTMLTDTSTLIAYTLPKEYDYDFSLKDKKTRQSLFIGDNKNSIFQNSFYPSKEMNESRTVREILEEILANYNGLPNSWVKVNNCEDIDSSDYLGYCDWNCGQEFACVHLKESERGYGITIGHNAYSVDSSSEYVYNNDTLESDPSECHHCSSTSDLTYIEYYDRYVCDSCLEEYYSWCEDIQEYRLCEDCYYLVDKGYSVSEDADHYWCEETEDYYSDAAYVEGYGYVNRNDIEDSSKFYKGDDGYWYRVCDREETFEGVEINA